MEKTRVIMNRSFELGARWGLAGAEKNPIKGVPRPRFSNAREIYIDGAQAARLIEAAAKSRNRQLAAAIQLLLLTGARVFELLSARWEHVDTGRRTWLIPKSKTGAARRALLAQAAIDIITALPRAKGAVFLFPSPADPAKHLTTIKHGWQAARKTAGLPDLRIHDLRHSAASFMVNSGVDLFAVGKVLGHASYQSTQRYTTSRTTRCSPPPRPAPPSRTPPQARDPIAPIHPGLTPRVGRGPLNRFTIRTAGRVAPSAELTVHFSCLKLAV